jgi:hypothetical protein
LGVGVFLGWGARFAPNLLNLFQKSVDSNPPETQQALVEFARGPYAK